MSPSLGPSDVHVLREVVTRLGALGQTELAEAVTTLLDATQGCTRPSTAAPVDVFSGLLHQTQITALAHAPGPSELAEEYPRLVQVIDNAAELPRFNLPLGTLSPRIDVPGPVSNDSQQHNPSPLLLSSSKLSCNEFIPSFPLYTHIPLISVANDFPSLQVGSEQPLADWSLEPTQTSLDLILPDSNRNFFAETRLSTIGDHAAVSSQDNCDVSYLKSGSTSVDDARYGFEVLADSFLPLEQIAHNPLDPTFPWQTQYADAAPALNIPIMHDTSTNSSGTSTDLISLALGLHASPGASTPACPRAVPIARVSDGRDRFERARIHRRAIKKGPGSNKVVKRRPFSDNKTKEETNLTRNLRACMRCHLYRIRVSQTFHQFCHISSWLT